MPIDMNIPLVDPTPIPDKVPAFAILSVSDITRGLGDILKVDCTISIAGGAPEVIVDHPYRASDPFGLNPVIRDWLAAHPQFPISPYVPPAAPSAEELRAQMQPLTARRLRLGLVNNGNSPSQVDAAIAAMPEGQDKERAKIEWEYASEYQRLHPLILTIGAGLNLTPETIDAMWLASANL